MKVAPGMLIDTFLHQVRLTNTASPATEAVPRGPDSGKARTAFCSRRTNRVRDFSPGNRLKNRH